DLRVADHRVFHVDRGDPLTTGFDHVFQPVGDFDECVPIDRGHIAGTPVPVDKFIGHFVFRHAVITRGDPRALNQHFALGFAIGWHLVTNAVYDFHLDVDREATLLGTVG